jgi:flagellar biosynthesis GTPase FlhF
MLIYNKLHLESEVVRDRLILSTKKTMKKRISKLGVKVFFLLSVLSSGCMTPEKKVEDAKEKVEQAKENLEEAKDYQKEMAAFKAEADEKIAANEKYISDLKLKTKNMKNEEKTGFEKMIADLELRNKNMQKKMNEYKVEGKENWEEFKKEFSRDMEELGTAFKNLFTSKNQ